MTHGAWPHPGGVRRAPHSDTWEGAMPDERGDDTTKDKDRRDEMEGDADKLKSEDPKDLRQ